MIIFERLSDDKLFAYCIPIKEDIETLVKLLDEHHDVVSVTLVD